MITNIISLKNETLDNSKVQSICENAIASLTSATYNNVPSEAKYEIEKYTIENLFEQLSSIEDPKIKSWVNSNQRMYTIKNLDLRGTLNKMIKENTHIAAGYILNEMLNRLNTTPEIFLYEDVISALSGYNYLPAIETGLSAISSRVDKYKNDLDITKILETMKTTKSNYIVPLIERHIENYLINKSEQSKSLLKEALMKFSYDPFVADMINILTLDATQLQLEYTKESVVETVYSPIIYNEEIGTIFNVKGTFYLKKGNSISKLSNKMVESLDVDFINLSNILNDQSVVVTESNISIYFNNTKAVINESNVTIGNEVYNKNDINNLQHSLSLINDKNSNVFRAIKIVFESYNDIAELDFVKRVSLNESINNVYSQFNGKSADIFRLRDNIFITTHDNINKSIFYRNVNPIQAKTIIKEHLNYDVSKAFSDILPQEEKILKEMEETKIEYVNYIQMLENKISEFNNIKDITDLLNEELADVKNEYKEYVAICEKYTRPIESNNSIDEELTLSIKNDKTGQSHTVIIPDEITNGLQTGNEAGSIVGAENVQQDASAVTFDADKSAALQDTSNITIPADAEEIEAEAEDAEEDAEEDIEKDTEEETSDEEKDDEESEETVTKSVDDKQKSKKKNENASKPRVFLKKKLNENAQIGDEVVLDGKRGYVTAKINNKLIVSIQGNTKETSEDSVTIKHTNTPDEINMKQMKFDELTQKVLFEQFVRCGIYMNNIPIKTTNCFVNYSSWNKAQLDENVSIIIDNNTCIYPKNQIKIHENINDFANPNNYAKGKILGLNETVLYNITDYNNSIGYGTSTQIRIIKLINDLPNSIEYTSANNISID